MKVRQIPEYYQCRGHCSSAPFAPTPLHIPLLPPRQSLHFCLAQYTAEAFICFQLLYIINTIAACEIQCYQRQNDLPSLVLLFVFLSACLSISPGRLPTQDPNMSEARQLKSVRICHLQFHIHMHTEVHLLCHNIFTSLGYFVDRLDTKVFGVLQYN